MTFYELKTILSLTEKLCDCQLCIFTRQEMIDYCMEFYDSNCNSEDDSCFAILSNGETSSTYDDQFCSKTDLKHAKAIYFSGAWGNAYFLSLEARKDETYFTDILSDVEWHLELDHADILESVDEENYASSLIGLLKKAIAEKTTEMETPEMETPEMETTEMETPEMETPEMETTEMETTEMETTICQLTCKSFDALPNIITPKDIDALCSCMYRLDKMCGDNPKAYRLLMPFHCLTFGDALCWTKDFCWESFIKDAIETGFTHIKKNLDDKSNPSLDFCFGEERGYSIKMVCDD